MRAIVLAAGTGKRLAPMGWTKPKCLLPFGDRTLLDLLVDALERIGVGGVVAVVGHQRELVEKALRHRHPASLFVVNPDYAETNTIHSLWLAREHLDDDFLYFNADVLFDDRILERLAAEPGSALAVEAKPCGKEEVKVITDEAGRIIRIGKKLAPADCLGEFIGVGKFAREVCPALIETLRVYNEVRGARQLFFESAVDDILEQHPFLAMPIGNLAAVEIDTPGDYDRALTLWQNGQVLKSAL